MSGIAGMVSLTRQRADLRLVERMAEQLRHRGPDDVGSFRAASGKAVLVCRRKAVIDLSPAARLPMTNEKRDVWVAFDGEIYNFTALRHSLELDGHQFASASDAEVIVHAYEQYGLAFLEQLHGMFAIALWDDRAGRMVLARDRLGKKPLYFVRHEGVVMFASEIKALIEVPFRRRIEPEALSQYLTFGCVMPPATLFEGVMKLAPGEALIVERGGVQRRMSWWSPGRDGRKAAAVRGLGPDQHAGHLRTLLESAVADRLHAEVPVAAWLSGGLDSAVVLAMMTRLTGRPIDAVTVAFPEVPESDERPFARDMAARVGARLHEVAVTEHQVAEHLLDGVQAMDEPLADPLAPMTWWAARYCRDNGLGVALSGDGADEVLVGHPDYLTYRRAAALWRLQKRLPTALKTMGARGLAPLLRAMGVSPSADLIRRACEGEAMFLGSELVFGDIDKWPLLGPEMRDSCRHWPASPVAERIQKTLPDWLRADPLGAMAACDLRTTLAERTLMRLDKLGMAHAVELRTPFLDHQLVDYALAIPGDQRAAGRRPKALLRRAVADLVPEAILRRPKLGPISPLSRWFKGDLGRLYEDKLQHGAIFQDGVLDPAACRAVLVDHTAGHAANHVRLWAILLLAQWYDLYRLEVRGNLMLPGAQALFTKPVAAE